MSPPMAGWRGFWRHGTNSLANTSVAVLSLWREDDKSRYIEFYRKQVCDPDLSRFRKLSKYLNANAKNVTNLLILLSVLSGIFLLD